jgi:hypothetical protein
MFTSSGVSTRTYGTWFNRLCDWRDGCYPRDATIFTTFDECAMVPEFISRLISACLRWFGERSQRVPRVSEYSSALESLDYDAYIRENVEDASR